MSLCINPICTSPQNPDDQLFCANCGSEVLLEGRYRVQGLLGEGGCGKTYEVSDLGGTTKVLKVLNKNQPKYVELFQREAQVLSQLEHPGIPSVEPNAYFAYYPKNAADPLYCLVMEKISGLDLQKYLRQRGSPIDQILAVQWLIQLCRILQAVHKQQFLHRDIKPSNIMLKADGHLVLIDFGTVRTITNVYDASEDSIQATRIMSALYTPTEQMKGKPVPQSDFFALGRTFVYLLTAKELGELYSAETDEFQWHHAVPGLSPRLANFLDRMMAPLVAQRPPNAEAILQELLAIQKDFYASSAILTPTQLGDAPTQLAAHRQNKGSVAPAKPTPLPPPPPPPSVKPAQPRVSAEFIAHCRQELAEYIGPIAAIICQRTLSQNPQFSESEFIEAIAAQITNPRDAKEFRQRFRF